MRSLALKSPPKPAESHPLRTSARPTLQSRHGAPGGFSDGKAAPREDRL